MPLLKSKSPACLVTALKKLFLAVQAHPQQPLFAFQHTKPYSHSRLSVLTYPSLMLYLRKWLELAGYQPFHYSCHASHAFSRNMPTDLIKKMGDWHSECYQQYLENDLTLHLSAVGGVNALITFLVTALLPNPCMLHAMLFLLLLDF